MAVLTGETTLPMLVVEGVFGTVTIEVTGYTTLFRVGSTGHVRPRGEIFRVTGQPRAGGNCVLCFFGPPNRAVEWSLADDSEAFASFEPVTPYTDQWGRATCVMTAGNAGTVTVKVRYGA